MKDICERYELPYNSGPLVQQWAMVHRTILRLAFPGGTHARSRARTTVNSTTTAHPGRVRRPGSGNAYPPAARPRAPNTTPEGCKAHHPRTGRTNSPSDQACACPVVVGGIAEMIVHCIETGRELTSDDAGHRRGSSPCPSLEGGTISRWSRHLATVITDTASTARDVLVEEGFYEAALAVLTDILEATTSLRRRRRSPRSTAPRLVLP